jgi:hypothetical protein
MTQPKIHESNADVKHSHTLSDHADALAQAEQPEVAEVAPEEEKEGE